MAIKSIPPWHKTRNDEIDNQNWAMLSDRAKVILHGCRCIAGQKNDIGEPGIIPMSAANILWRLRLEDDQENKTALEELSGTFLVRHDDGSYEILHWIEDQGDNSSKKRVDACRTLRAAAKAYPWIKALQNRPEYTNVDLAAAFEEALEWAKGNQTELTEQLFLQHLKAAMRNKQPK